MRITNLSSIYFINQCRLGEPTLSIGLDTYIFFNQACMCVVYYRSSLDDAIFASAAGFSGPTALPPEKIKVRKNFPETWLWQMLDAG